jgi:hypothetical protein
MGDVPRTVRVNPGGRYRRNEDKEGNRMTANELTWDALFYRGSIADLDINIWSAKLNLRPSDIDVADTPDVREALTLGTMRLAPKKSFDRILQIRRAALKDVENSSFNFPFLRGARYVPEAKVAGLLFSLEKRRDEFEAAVADFSEKYNFIRAETIPVIRRALLDSGCKDIESAMARVNNEYPTDIVSHFGFSWKMYAISGAKSAAGAEAATEETAQVKGILAEIVKQLRDEFSEKVRAIAGIIGRGGKIPSTSIDSCREVLARVKSMNVFGDAELTNQVRAFERILALDSVVGPDTNKVPGLAADLDKIQDVLKTSLDDAIANAEKNLTGLGRRKIEVAI